MARCLSLFLINNLHFLKTIERRPSRPATTPQAAQLIRWRRQWHINVIALPEGKSPFANRFLFVENISTSCFKTYRLWCSIGRWSVARRRQRNGACDVAQWHRAVDTVLVTSQTAFTVTLWIIISVFIIVIVDIVDEYMIANNDGDNTVIIIIVVIVSISCSIGIGYRGTQDNVHCHSTRTASNNRHRHHR